MTRDLFDDSQPCSLGRQLAVMAGALSVAGLAGFAITFAAVRWLIEGSDS